MSKDDESTSQAWPLPWTPEETAERFHNAYEYFAPKFGWQTSPASAVAWDEVPQANKDLMIAVVRNVLIEQLSRSSHSEHASSGGERAVAEKYEIQVNANNCYRITEKSTDSRVATCYTEENARLVTNALNSLPSSQPEANPWRETIIEDLIVDCIYEKAHDSDPRKALDDLIVWEQKIALDPAVSKEARDLIERGRPQPEPSGELEALRRDAERYRWLKDSAHNEFVEHTIPVLVVPGVKFSRFGWDDDIDTAIDAALRASGEKDKP